VPQNDVRDEESYKPMSLEPGSTVFSKLSKSLRAYLAKRVSHWLTIVEVRVRLLDSRWRICGGNVTPEQFLSATSVSCCQYHLTNAPYVSVYLPLNPHNLGN
jgi:hypothetical protein